MITPKFTLTQNNDTVTITIRAPYSNLRELDVSVDENIFIFLSAPYYLRLHLPGSLIDNDCQKSSYDVDSGEFQFHYEKALSGEHFPDLDFITKFLAPKIEVGNNNDERKITVLTTTTSNSSDDDDFNKNNSTDYCYGFAMDGKNFRDISSQFCEVFEIDPKEIQLEDRRKLRLKSEQNQFDRVYYLTDYHEDEDIREITTLVSPWSKLIKPDDVAAFTDNELDFLKNLNNKTTYSKLSDTQIKYCFCGLIDILYAYCYDRRTTYFEGTIESGWTIIKLAASFCWLDGFQNVKDAVINSFRRSLIYPLYRNFKLSEIIFNDLKQLLRLGEKFIIKCLIEMYQIFLTGDCDRYIINNLFIKDYIQYVMQWEKDKWSEIVQEVSNLTIQKSDLGLNLADVEDDDIISNMARLSLRDSDSDDSSIITDSDDEHK